MESFNRSTLKGFFQKGKVPTEVHFANLIDSTINKVDDGLSKTPEYGLRLTPGDKNQRVLSFFGEPKDYKPQWSIGVNPVHNVNGLAINNEQDDTKLFLKKDGGIGINTLYPRADLDINGTLASSSRMGTYSKNNEVPADGEWHTIISQLSSCHVFEVVAKVSGVKNRGKYAISHAIALSAEGGRKSKIRVTQAAYGWFWHKLRFRWKYQEDGDYALQLKTQSHYGTDENEEVIQVSFHVTSLWK